MLSNRSLTFSDGEHITLQRISKMLDFQEHETSKLVDFLLNKQIIIPLRRGEWRIKFVGFIGFQNILMWFAPKSDIISNDYAISRRFSILRAIDKYRATNNRLSRNMADVVGLGIDCINEELDQKHLFRFVDLCFEILRDHTSSGLIDVKIQSSDLDGGSDIDWERTFDSIQPMFDAEVPIFLDFYSFRTRQDLASDLRRVHEYVVGEAAGWLTRFGIDQLFGFSVAPHSIDMKLTSFDLSEPRIANILERAIQAETNDIRIHKLRLIEYYIRLRDLVTSDSLILGTRDFHVVWENVCSVIFDDRFASSGPDTKLIDSIESFPHEVKFHDNFFPHWEIAQEQGVAEPRVSSLRPDIVAIQRSENSSELQLLIIDAKYYDFRKNLPGASDISKQMLYEMGLQDLAESCSVRIIENYFALPAGDNAFSNLGCVALPFMRSYTRSCVKVIGVPFYRAIDNYLRGSRGCFLGYVSSVSCIHSTKVGS